MSLLLSGEIPPWLDGGAPDAGALVKGELQRCASGLCVICVLAPSGLPPQDKPFLPLLCKGR